MNEKTAVRDNMMKDKHYRPYCGGDSCRIMPRVDEFFTCPNCGWVATFDEQFLSRYRKKWADIEKYLEIQKEEK